MANEIYSSSWWGDGPCNDVGWGIIYKQYANCGPVQPIIDAFVIRVEADGGTVESTPCLETDLTFLTENPIVPDFTGLLNDYSGAAAAYSLRLLDNTYSGNAVRVRRASDNTEQDIGFANNELDTTSLETFCSGTNGFVTTWYDQSGNANNAANATAARQPSIVSSGSVLLLNSKPAIDPLGGRELNFNTLSLNGDFNIVNVSDFNRTTMPYGGGSGNFVYFMGATQVRYRLGGITFNYTTPTMVDGDQLLMNINRSGNDLNYHHLGSDLGTENDASPVETFAVDRLFTGNGSVYGAVANQEIIIWESDQSSNRTGIETNINTHYSIY